MRMTRRLTVYLLSRTIDDHKACYDFNPEEVEEALFAKPSVKKVGNGDVKGENLYIAFGRTQAGRYLSVLFVLKKDKRALVISARNMTKRERKQYGKR